MRLKNINLGTITFYEQDARCKAALYPKKVYSPVSSPDVVKENNKQRASFQKVEQIAIEITRLWTLFPGIRVEIQSRNISFDMERGSSVICPVGFKIAVIFPVLQLAPF